MQATLYGCWAKITLTVLALANYAQASVGTKNTITFCFLALVFPK
jgi:hypothetical protein